MTIEPKAMGTIETGTASIEGACHCGAVRFSVRLSGGLEAARRCDCSYCGMRGAVVVSAATQDLTVLAGQEMLSTYRFNSLVAEHHFCSRCGIYTHHRRRSNPTQFGVNVACLGLSPFAFREVPVNDGQNHPADPGGLDRVAGMLRYEPSSNSDF
ncbi:GFA family protein [Lichenihabitans sp. Uapishka_5]|uniref:GFA family protein n=1 Tax=Lichenihabitans sp. Uapishka_5 TaxID=3037302 RepID=UPI0029E7DCC7|nr:GFA family protein [Lichenihabitans sp. Uapishka_5]MDX7951407.1 GFA family protein [Lichenihabitans sp. Uapishka_5]